MEHNPLNPIAKLPEISQSAIEQARKYAQNRGIGALASDAALGWNSYLEAGQPETTHDNKDNND